MRIDNLMQSLRMLAQADTMIADITFRNRLSQIALRSAAFFIALFGLIMLGIGGYSWLRDLWGPVWAALAVAAASFIVALAIAIVAANRKPGREIEMAREMHTVALDSLIAEAKLAGNDFAPFGGLLHGHLDGALLNLIGPLASLLLRFLNRSSSPKSEA
jgi:hypothetical protein